MTPHLPLPAGPAPHVSSDERVLRLLGAAVASEWAGLSPGVQRTLFDAAMAGAVGPDAAERELLARFLHARHGALLR
jgi:hypothetical protein